MYKTPYTAYFIIITVLTFALTALAARILIPKLKSIKMGQKILDIGPRWHKSKEGTPTMGGLSFIFASAAVFLTVCVFIMVKEGGDFALKLIITVITALLNGVIGFFDDLVKYSKKQNEGLTAWQKMLIQLSVSGAYLFAMTIFGFISTSVHIPFLGISLELGWFYYIFALILITGTINGVNFTDGIDGLASTVTFIVGAFFAVAAFKSDNGPAAVVSALLIGACLGFLVYNFHPAKIFMGDTGSLFLGGLVTGAAFLINDPLIIVTAGIIYMIEVVSVILQVGYFKLTRGKRLFKMAPIHHHFEKCGYGEIKIVTIFSAVTLIMCAVSYFRS